MKLSGSMTAIITPFTDGKVDENALRSLINWQIEEGTDVIVPCGTTGEGATLSYEEHERVIKICVEEVSGRVPILAGAGSNATQNAIKLARQAAKAGADAMLQVTPYYNKPPQEGLYQHFLAIAKAVDLPMVVYNVPGRTAVNLLPETVERLAKIDTIIGIKEACGNLDQIKKLANLVPPTFSIYSGDDALNLDIYKLGGKGAISVTANVAPRLVARVWDEYLSGDIDAAKKSHDALDALNKAMFFETNPLPAKTSLAIMGRCKEEFRLPLCTMQKEKRQELLEVLKSYKMC